MSDNLDTRQLVLQLDTYRQEYEQLSASLENAASDCVTELHSIADDVDKFHRGATITNVVGSAVGIAGGITTLVGLALAPVTLGASLIVSGVGIAAATAGGVTGVSASIADTVNTKKQCETVQKKIEEINNMTHDLQILASNMSKLATQIKDTVEVPSGMKEQGPDLARMGGKGVFVAVEIGRLAQLSRISSAAARGAELAGQGARAIRAVSGVFAALFVFIDAFFLVKGSVELHRGAKTEIAAKIREKAHTLQINCHEMRENNKSLIAELTGFISELEREIYGK